jgi:hypothetical protein
VAPLSPGHWYFLAAGPYAVYVLLAELPLASHWPSIDTGLKAALSLSGCVVSGIAIHAMKCWRWRFVLGLLATALAILCFLHTYRSAEILGFAGYRYRLRAIGLWGSFVIAAAGTAIVAVAVDVIRSTRRDWLHYLAIMALSLSAATCFGAFGHIIKRFWLDCLSRLVA